MEPLDSKILNQIQRGLPLSENPFHDLAAELGIEPDSLIARLQYLKDAGYIRRIGGIFNTAKMGYQSILIAMTIPPERIAAVTHLISGYSEITHNYLRSSRLNIWFTLSTQSEAKKKQILQTIMVTSGVDYVYQFPAVQHFKLNVFFDMENSNV